MDNEDSDQAARIICFLVWGKHVVEGIVFSACTDSQKREVHELPGILSGSKTELKI